MKRSAFKVQRPPGMREPRTPKQIGTEYNLRPRAVAVAVAGPARATVAVPKFAYVRDDRLRDMCRAMPCMCCGATGEQAGVTWAHSNQAIHGHGRGIKASDEFCAAMCTGCHRELDQGNTETQAEKVARWNNAWRKTISVAITNGLWPIEIPLPTRHRTSDPASAGFVVVGRYQCKNTPASMMPANTMNSAGSMMQHTTKTATNRPFTAIQP